MRINKDISVSQGVNVLILELRADADPLDLKRGDILNQQTLHNLWVLTGRNWLRDRITGDESDSLGYFAAGSGTTAAADSDTALETEVVRNSWIKTTKSDSQIVFQSLIMGNNGTTFTEGGAFDAASSGTMYNRFVHTAIAKTPANQILYQITILLQEG